MHVAGGLTEFLIGLYWISAPAPENPESAAIRKSDQVRLLPNFQPDLADAAVAV